MTKIETPVVSRRHLLDIAASLGFFAVSGAAAGAATATAPAATLNDVVGAWKLESFDVETGPGTMRPGFGIDPVGYLMYTASGRMSAILAAAQRPKFDTPDASTSTEAQRTQALANVLAYAGRYEIRGDRVFHHVEVSVFTNLMGTTLEREFKISGDTLTIRTVPPDIWGRSSKLIWKRT